jgi:hypothetical protein
MSDIRADFVYIQTLMVTKYSEMRSEASLTVG